MSLEKGKDSNFPEIEAINKTFIEVARKYCSWVEGTHHDIPTLRELLLRLMLEAPTLRRPEKIQEREDAEYPSREFEGWQQDYKRFKDMPFDLYHGYFNPLNMDDPSPLTHTLADDLSGIYGDLWHGLQALHAGDEDYAASYWSEMYYFHWGRHAAQALTAVDDYFRTTESNRLLE